MVTGLTALLDSPASDSPLASLLCDELELDLSDDSPDEDSLDEAVTSCSAASSAAASFFVAELSAAAFFAAAFLVAAEPVDELALPSVLAVLLFFDAADSAGSCPDASCT